MRELHYAVEGKAANLRTFAIDEPGAGGACHEYVIAGPNGHGDSKTLGRINFQNGQIHDFQDKDGPQGVNGIHNEDLLAIIIDRLNGFQNGPYASGENRFAMDHCKDALEALQRRSRRRIVEGK